MTRYYLELINPEENHRKFYEVEVVGSHAMFHWGRIGTEGQEKQFDFMNNAQAVDFAARKMYEKINKGYELKNEVEKVRA